MREYKIIRLTKDNFEKFKTIWVEPKNLERFQNRMNYWYKELDKNNRIFFIYSSADEYLGEASLIFDYGEPDYTILKKRICLIEMTVKKGYRNLGIGGQIIDYLFSYAKNLGYSEMSVGVNIDNYNARHLYEKKGFSEVIFEGEDENGKYVKLLKKL